MKVFITGVAGFLGSHIADEMIKQGHSVIGVDNFLGGYSDNVPRAVKFFEWDLNNLDGLSDLMGDCDLIYHTACTAYEGLSVFSPSLVVRNTTQISVNAMTAAIQANVGRFVHCSSMARYGTQPVVPFREDMSPLPQDPYGIAKYAAELLLRNLAEIHGVHLSIAVPHNIIGPRQKYDDPFRNVASIMINLMLQNRSPIIYGDGSQVRCFSDIRDVVGCLVDIAFYEGPSGEVFNIGPDENEVSINSLFELISSKIGFNEGANYMSGRPQEVKHAVCSSDKIRKYFGYETKYGLSESVDSMLEYISSRGVRDFNYHLPIEIINDLTPKTWTQRLF